MSFLISRAVVVQVPSVTSGPAASVSLKNLLEMPILEPYPRPIESESLGPSKLFCNKSLRWFWWLPKSEKHCPRAGNRLISFTAATAIHSSLTVHRTGTYVTWEWAGTFEQERQAFLPLHLFQSLTFTDKNFESQKKCECGGASQGHTVSCGNENGFLLSRVPLPCTFLPCAPGAVGRMDKG